ncbi:MAG: hypothetical protein WCW27_03685 [Patescibacteria group bacterium]|jgi:hypothetical protein
MNNANKWLPKYKIDPILPVVITFLGVTVTSLVIGMLLFPVFTKVCVAELLYSLAKLGYFGIMILCFGLMLEAYNLYEHHRKHVIVLVAITILMSIVGIWLIRLVSTGYSC